jgi:C4-dicarboxylate-specific signal transduction histidine kinase
MTAPFKTKKELLEENYLLNQRKRMEEAIHRVQDELEQRVADRTKELMRVNEELLKEIN